MSSLDKTFVAEAPEVTKLQIMVYNFLRRNVVIFTKLVQIMACRLVGAKPLPEPTLE